MLSYDGYEAPIGISGLLATEDGKVITRLLEFKDPETISNARIGNIGARGTSNDKELRQASKHSFSLVASLGKRTLDHIDTVRNRNKKRDVVFKLSLNVRTVKSISFVSPLHELSPGEIGPPLRALLEQKGFSLIAYKYDHAHQTRIGNLWPISGDNGPVFLSVDDYQFETAKTIRASDWIQDFAPQFGLGRFVVVELPTPTASADGSEFAEALSEAAKKLQEMEKEIDEGEWSEAIAKSRRVAELLRRDEIIKRILGNYGNNEDAAKSLLAAVQNLFDYGSKFIHAVHRDKTTILADANAEKEDAYLVYSLLANLVNMLARKAAKTESIQS